LNRKKSHIVKKTVKGRYVSDQLFSNIPLCDGDHVYGNFDLLGPLCIPGKACVKCTHIIYKDEVIKRRESLRERLRTIKTHVDLFQF
jgi:hypothetical protein